LAFRELMEGLKLSDGCTSRFRKMEALDRMLDGSLYDDLTYSFETESAPGRKYINLRDRRPSVDFNISYVITQDTLAELFGDEQFPAVRVIKNGDPDDPAEKALQELIETVGLADVAVDVYEAGVVGSVGVVMQRSDDGLPYFDVLPGRWCQPIYVSQISRTLKALMVTMPIDKEAAIELEPDLLDDDRNQKSEQFWYRYLVGPNDIADYKPMPDDLYARLGEKYDDTGDEIIEFTPREVIAHGFKGRVPAIYVKNLGGRPQDIDGMALWWPIRNICVEIDYTLSQAGRGLRYAADPRLFIRTGELDDGGGVPAGYDKPAGGTATQLDDAGKQVSGVGQVYVARGASADAKLLEISADGITEEREYVRDLREYAFEVLGGMKARAEHLKGAPSGTALDKGLKPLRRLIRRQRRPYGNGGLLALIDLVVYGQRIGALDITGVDFDAIPDDAKNVLDWPNDDTLQGTELLAHVEGLQYACGGSIKAPKELIKPEAIGAKLSGDLGLHEPYSTIKGSCDAPPQPQQSGGDGEDAGGAGS
jgi:hypothetical protein